MDTWDSCWSRWGYSAPYLRNIPSLHITHLIILQSLFQSWFAVKRHLILLSELVQAGVDFVEETYLSSPAKCRMQLQVPKCSFLEWSSTQMKLFWVAWTPILLWSSESNVVEDHIELHKIQFCRRSLSCMESSFALSCILLAITIFLAYGVFQK